MGRLLRRWLGTDGVIVKSVTDHLDTNISENYRLAGIKKSAEDTLSLALQELSRLKGVKKSSTDSLSIFLSENAAQLPRGLRVAVQDILNASLSEEATRIQGSVPAESINDDAYSDYNTLHVNLSSGSDSNSGLSEGNAKKTLQAAAAIATPFTRILVQGQGILTNFVTLPGGDMGFMGYPDKPMPDIELGNYNFCFSANGARPRTFARKLHLFNQMNGQSGLVVGLNNAQNDFRGEYLHIHGIFGTDDNCAAIYLKNGTAHNATIRRSKLYNVRETPGGSFFHNGPTILSYGNDNTLVEYCDLSLAQYGFRSKAAPNGGKGPKIRKNIIHDIFFGNQGPAGVRLGRDAGGGSYDDSEFIGNLVYNIPDGVGFMIFDQSVVAERVKIRQNTFAEDVFCTMEIRGARFDWINNVYAGTNIAFMTKESYVHRALEVQGNSYRQGCSWILGEYLSGTNRRVYPNLTQPSNGWRFAKTLHNHISLSELNSTNPDTISTEFSSLVNNFVAYQSRQYGLSATSPAKGSGLGGVDPGYNPADCGAGW